MKNLATQAELWVRFLKMRTDNMSMLTGLDNVDEAVKIIKQLSMDYPNQEFKLTSKGSVVGMRRVFGDRSYVDFMLDDLQNGVQQCTIGTMGEGMLGTAGNGTIIH
jgi:hypothetical protein